MSHTATLTRMLAVTDSQRDGYLLPSGYVITVHVRTSGEVYAVAYDGRVYRANTAAVALATATITDTSGV